MSREASDGSTTGASKHRVEGQQCSGCTHWERHEPRDAAGFCEKHVNSFAMEDEWCSDFSVAKAQPE